MEIFVFRNQLKIVCQNFVVLIMIHGMNIENNLPTINWKFWLMYSFHTVIMLEKGLIGFSVIYYDVFFSHLVSIWDLWQKWKYINPEKIELGEILPISLLQNNQWYYITSISILFPKSMGTSTLFTIFWCMVPALIPLIGMIYYSD